MHIIGITGAAGAGKDTIADALVELRGFLKLSFADPVKQAAGVVAGAQNWADRAWKEAPIPHLGVSPRQLAQFIGTEGGRALHPDLWVRYLAHRVDVLQAMGFVESRVVIPDVRFQNEVDWIHSRGGMVVRVFRGDITPVSEHGSETQELTRIDSGVFNNGSIEQLRGEALYLFDYPI